MDSNQPVTTYRRDLLPGNLLKKTHVSERYVKVSTEATSVNFCMFDLRSLVIEKCGNGSCEIAGR